MLTVILFFFFCSSSVCLKRPSFSFSTIFKHIMLTTIAIMQNCHEYKPSIAWKCLRELAKSLDLGKGFSLDDIPIQKWHD